MSHRNTFFFTLAAVLGLLSACSPQPEAGGITAPPELTVTAGNQSCTALRGGWIYEIRAGWDRMPDFEGTSSYTVFICME